MIPINLLPHRAARRKAQQQQFFILAGMTIGLAAAIVVAVHTFFAGRIEARLSATSTWNPRSCCLTSRSTRSES